MVVASLAVSNYFDPLVPSSLPQLQHESNRQREQLNQLSSTLASTGFVCDCSNSKHRYYVKSFLLRVYFENDVKCDKKAVTAASLESRPCQIQRLIITNNDTANATNTTTQRGFNSRSDYAKTTDLKR